MKTQYDLSQLDWTLSGWTPDLWRMNQTAEIGASPSAEVPAIPAKVPGSVQYALRKAGIIPDWNLGLNHRECEWVENRHWIYEAVIPDEWIEQGKTYHLNCRGLDYNGEIYINGLLVKEFNNSHLPVTPDITPFLQKEKNILRIMFGLPPRWLGQFGFTERMTEWKPRFNYTWDWTPRLVQIGIWNNIFIEATDGLEITEFRCTTDADTLQIKGKASDGIVVISLSRDGEIIREEELPAAKNFSLTWSDLPVELWWPNMHGDQPLYDLTCQLLDKNGSEKHKVIRRVGFKHIEWTPCEGAPENADPWICVVNGKPIFLQGVNWTPILPNFADATEDDYRKRLILYRDLGLNILRVWGGAFLEKKCFYDLCDELGILVWQEFPLSSSGGSSYPPDDEKTIAEMSEIAKSFIARRQHHVSLVIWSGGNELCTRDFKPLDTSHPLIKRFEEICAEEDPTHRFLATSPTGPSFCFSGENVGKGVHWDTHGPWKAEGDLSQWAEYWSMDDSLFRSETGSPGPSSAEIIRRSAGEYDVMPISQTNPLWRRGSHWWVEPEQFAKEHGREPKDLEEYVAWGQERQKQALTIAVKTCKDRFPKCGGVIIWMGHDCFPCNANTSIVDFDGNPKPAALAIADIWR